MRAFFAKAKKPRKTARHGAAFALTGLTGWSNLTPFQQKVLAAVYRIPRGQVRTYAQIAKAAGRPNAARAVGSVMKMNPYAPFIPCHRVVRSDGLLGFYSGKGGMAGKKKMLQKEGVRLYPVSKR